MLSRLGRMGTAAGIVAIASAAMMMLAAPMASADPAPSTHATPSQPKSSEPGKPAPDVSQDAVPSFPMPVREGALGYLATRSATLWLNDRGAPDVVASLPAPPPYSTANKQMAKALDRELTAAAKTPGACLQIIVDSGDAGGLFNYGFFAVEKQYCPK